MVRSSESEGDAHAGLVQQLRILEAGAERSKSTAGCRADPGSPARRRRQLVGDQPGFAAAGDHGLHAVRRREADDMRGCPRRARPEDHAAAARDRTSARRGLPAGAGRLRRGRRLAHFADRLVEQHVVRGAAAAGSVVAALPQFTNSDLLPASAASKRPSSVTAAPWPAIRLSAARAARHVQVTPSTRATGTSDERAIESRRDVELRDASVLPGGRHQLEVGVHRRGLRARPPRFRSG